MIAVVLIGALGLSLLFSGLTAGSVQERRPLLPAFVAWRSRRLPHAGVLRASAGAGALTAVVTALWTSSLPAAVGFGVVGMWLPVSVNETRELRRRRAAANAWPDALGMLTAAVRSGVSLQEACVGLAQRGPVPLRGGFDSFARTYRATGAFRRAMHGLVATLDDPVADRVAAALIIAHEVGGSDLVRVLHSLSESVRDDLMTRREIEARWSWTIVAARLAAAAPWVVLAMMLTRPEAAAAFSTREGAVIVGAGIAATVVGYRAMLRAGRLDPQVRIRL